MPDGRAVKPGDVVTSMKARPSDFEHRCRRAPGVVRCVDLRRAIQACRGGDIATLTGACVIALGGVRSDLFANNDGLAESLPGGRRRRRKTFAGACPG